jgi:hypothetical protein
MINLQMHKPQPKPKPKPDALRKSEKKKLKH